MSALWSSAAARGSSCFLKVQPDRPAAAAIALNCEDAQFSLVFSEAVGDPGSRSTVIILHK